MEVDRRSFLKGGALAASAAALTMAGTGLMGCSAPKQDNSLSSTGPNAGTSVKLPDGLVMSDIEQSCVELDPISEFAAEETYDIVVVGAGCAGVPATLTALEEGATVGVLQKEADASANGNGASAVILGQSDTAAVKRWMADWAKENKWRLNNELFQYYVDHSEDTLSWIIQQGDSVDFSPASYKTSASIIYDDGTRIATYEASSPSNDELMKKLIVKAQDLGAVVHFNTPAVQIVQDDNGRVTGVIGKNENGDYIKMNANVAVIMAAGDYMNNDSLTDRYCPDPVDLYRKQTNRTGDGHILSSMAGGRIVRGMHPKMCHDLQCSAFTFMATPLLALDPQGKRFFNEECVLTSWSTIMMYHYKDEQPIMYRFFDSEYAEKYEGVGQIPPLDTLEANVVGVTDNPQRRIFKGNTIEEICEQLDLDSATFKASIEAYNEMCRAGRDDEFGKDAKYMQTVETAPFYCIETKPGLSAIDGGVYVDEHYQVIDADDNPIEGLYAAGVNAGNLCGGVDWAMPGGSSNCHCFNAGRYTVIHALTGGLEPTNKCTFDQVADRFVGEDGKFIWEKPGECRNAIEIW